MNHVSPPKFASRSESADMATLLDAQKAPNSAKIEEFVNRQIQAARRRVRLLDFFSAGLVVVITSLLFLLLVQFIDRAY